MAIHPLHLYVSTLAVSDAMFTTFVAFGVLSAIWLARKPTWGRSVLLAVALGMGAATKLSPLLIAVGWTAYACILFLDPWLRSRERFGRAWGLVSRKELGTERQLGWKLLVQTGLVGSFFVLVYPFLWPDPIGRTKIIFDFRKYEMDNQAGFWPQAAIHGPFDAMKRTWQNLQDRTSSTGAHHLLVRRSTRLQLERSQPRSLPGGARLIGARLSRLEKRTRQSAHAGHAGHRGPIGADPRRARGRLQPLLRAAGLHRRGRCRRPHRLARRISSGASPAPTPASVPPPALPIPHNPPAAPQPA